MSKYRTVFWLRFSAGLQYRAAAWSGIATQFVWGFLEILMFRAFYQADAQAFPMTFTALVDYVWLQQGLLALFMIWFWENDIFESIQSGNIAYELVRPVSVYNLWFIRTLGTRLARTVLRAGPVLLIAMILPEPFRLHLPPTAAAFAFFLLSLCLALGVIISLNMIVYFLAFYTINSFGIRMVFQSLGELLAGGVIPLPFFPAQMRHVLELLPFASIQNVPFRIYSGDLAGAGMVRSLALQIFWFLTLLCFGKLLEGNVVKKVVIQGG